MFTWTCKTLVFPAAALALAACGASPFASRDATDIVRLPSGIVVEGSRGWCVATDRVRMTDAASVVVLGSCAAIAKNTRLPEPPISGIITVSVDNLALGTIPADVLDSFFASDQGRAALARDGRADSVLILETRQEDDALFLHAIDRSGVPTSAAEDYWRAIFDIDGRFVTVSLVGLNDKPIARDAGLKALEDQVERLRSANAERA